MAIPVEVIEIKRKTMGLCHQERDIDFMTMNRDMLRTTNGMFLSGEAAYDEVVAERQSRRAVHIRDNRGQDKFIVWSPEFEEFVGVGLNIIEELQAEIKQKSLDNHFLKSELNNSKILVASEKKAHDKTKNLLDGWQSIAERFKCRLHRARKVSFTLKVGSLFAIYVYGCIVYVGTVGLS